MPFAALRPPTVRTTSFRGILAFICVLLAVTIACAGTGDGERNEGPSKGGSESGSGGSGVVAPTYAPCPDTGCGPKAECFYYLRGGTRLTTCEQYCEDDASVCGDTRVCVHGTYRPNRSFCTPKCRMDADCTKGLSCNTQTGACGCTEDSDCATAYDTGFRCGSDKVCQKDCGTSLDCRCGSVCSTDKKMQPVDGGPSDAADASVVDASSDAGTPDGATTVGSGVCIAGCTQDADCCGDAKCLSGKCERLGPAGPTSRCSTGLECTGSLNCYVEFSRGMCSAPIAGETCADAQCQTGYVCQSIWSSEKKAFYAGCVPPCTPGPQAECPRNAVCLPTRTGGPGACTPQCVGHDICGPSSTCTGNACSCSASGCLALGASATCNPSSGSCVCTPSCAGKACGPDGCGGWCGTCADGLHCSKATSQCVGTCEGPEPAVPCGGNTYCPSHSKCQPGNRCQCDGGRLAADCSGTACSASTCPHDWQCKICAPQCQGRSCGGDGCGGFCGSCPAGSSCSSAGQCTTNSGGGAACPQCANGQICVTIGSTSQCSNTCTSNSQCASGCCGSLQTGGGACAPPNYCSSTSGRCPPGTAPITPGGQCVSRPSSCANGAIVCGCPETHGEWCHLACKYPINCGGNSNPEYPCH